MSAPRPKWTDRHEPGPRVVMGCGVAAFAGVWSLMCRFVILLMWGAQPPDGWSGSRVSLALHDIALFQLPFVYPAVLLWYLAVMQFRQVRLRPHGLAVVRRVPDGWAAVVPSGTGFLLAVGAGQLVLFLTAFVPLALLGKRNPLWVWYPAVPLAVAVAVIAYRRWHHNPTVVVDEAARTVSLSRGRRKPPLVVPWAAVQAVDVLCRSGDGSCDYICRVTVRTGDGTTEPVDYGHDSSYPEPVERFAAWLRERLAVEGGP